MKVLYYINHIEFDPIHESKYKPKIKSQKVLDDAYQKRIDELNELKEQNDFYDTVAQATYEFATEEEEKRRKEKKLADKQLQLDHIKQMKEKELQKAEENTYNHFIPPDDIFSASMIGIRGDPREHKKRIQQQTKYELENQIEKDKRRSSEERARELYQDREYLESIDKEVQRQLQAEKEDRIKQRHDLEYIN